MKLGKGVGKMIVKAAKEAGEEAAEQGVKQVIKNSPKHVKKMAHTVVDEAGNAVKKAVKTVSENPETWEKAKESIKDATKNMWENKKKTWDEDFKRIQEMYNNKEFDLDEAREYIKGFYYKDLTPEKEEELVKTLEANRKKHNKNQGRTSRRQQNKDKNTNKNQNQGNNQQTLNPEDFKTASEMEGNTDGNNTADEGNNFDAEDFFNEDDTNNSTGDGNNTNNSGNGDGNNSGNSSHGPLDFDTDDPNYKFTDREDFKYRRTNGHVDRIQDKKTGETYRVIRNDDGRVIGFTDSNDASVSAEKANELLGQVNNERADFISNMSDRDWDNAYREHAFDDYDGEGYGFKSKEEVLAARKQSVDNRIKEIDKQLENMDKKADKKEYKKLLEEQQKLKAKKEGINYREQLANKKAAHAEQLKELEDAYKQSIEGLAPDSDAYKEAEKLFENNKKLLETTQANSIDKLKERTQGSIAAHMDDTGWAKKLGKGISTAFTVKSAVDKYKESRAEGRSVASSVVRAGASAAAADMIGPVGGFLLGAAKMVPGAVIGGVSYIASEHRRMNSAANYTPLGGVSFQDSQELATMRQSGMELAKMSQYNLEQTLMGSEAKHLHR